MSDMKRLACSCVVLAAMLLGPGCPNPAFEAADVVRGGQLYDNWWATTEAAQPTTDHPLWASRPDLASNTRTGADTWRCKECHGWDYKGVDGAYGSGSHRTGISGVFGVSGADIRTKSAQSIFNTIKTNHSYGDVLADADIWDLAKFVLEGQLDADDIVDDSGAFIGNASAGQSHYGVCAGCHGQDGLTPPPGHPEFNEYPGLLADENPWEVQHKISFGQPGTAMPAQFTALTVSEIGDLGAYLQQLPTAPSAKTQ